MLRQVGEVVACVTGDALDLVEGNHCMTGPPVHEEEELDVDVTFELLPLEGEPGLFVALFSDGSYFRCTSEHVYGAKGRPAS
jgi:hypothetical protein